MFCAPKSADVRTSITPLPSLTALANPLPLLTADVFYGQPLIQVTARLDFPMKSPFFLLILSDKKILRLFFNTGNAISYACFKIFSSIIVMQKHIGLLTVEN